MQPRKYHDEVVLLRRLRVGDRDAFQKIYDHYFPKLRVYVFKFVRAPQYTEDILQEVFMKLWEIKENIDPEKYFSGYLYTITKNQVIKFFKSAAYNQEMVDDIIISMAVGDTHVQEAAEWKELYHEIQHAIELLPPRRQEIFLLCREENMSYDQISSHLHISRNTIKEHMVLAMKAIRAYLRERSLFFLSGILFLLPILS